MDLVLALLVLVMSSQAPAPAFPQDTISGGGLTATVYLPDARGGYYRGTRFDWSGVVASLRWRNHEFFGPWFTRHDPLGHDGITGPVEEFQAGDSSVGYDEAPVGGTFLRIGVGHVRKPQEAAFRRFGTYEIVDPGAWTIEKGADSITFVHRLAEREGYAYEYRKTLRLGRDSLVIEHALRNTGRKPIVTAVYNHNFFTIDGRTIGPSVSVRLPFTPTPTQPLGPLAALDGATLRFTRDLARGQHVFTEFTGLDAATPYDFRLEQAASGVGVRMRADRPLTKLVFWSASTTACPEPYIDASAAPGATSTWTLTYDFYELAASR